MQVESKNLTKCSLIFILKFLIKRPYFLSLIYSTVLVIFIVLMFVYLLQMHFVLATVGLLAGF